MICALAAIAATLSAAAAGPQTQAVHAMSIESGVLTGPGGELLLLDIPSAQFVLIGEDHGFADPPAIALALARAGRPHGLVNHVVEVGPLSDRWAGDILNEGGVDALAAALAGRPLALPFVSMREDAELAAYFRSKARRNSDVLWGVDQEFIGSTLILLERLSAIAPNAEAKKLALDALAAERTAFAAGDQSAMLLLSAVPETFAGFERAFSAGAEAKAIIAALKESAAVYSAYGAGKNYASNADRIALIRRQFLKAYGAANGRAPRALMKMGAIHLGLGSTFLNTFDLGSLSEGIAAANGLEVLRIAVMPLEGRRTEIMPTADGAFRTADFQSEDVAALLGAIGVSRDDLPTEGYGVIVLDPARRILEQKGLSKLTDEQRFFVLGFDYLVTTRNARPATPLAK